MSCIVYELKLKNSKYYVGRTSNINSRISQHKMGRGSTWTKKYPMEKLIAFHENCDPYDEDKYTLKLMEKHGVENVRGGSYVMTKFSKADIEDITRKIRMASNKCVRCGSSKHFVFRCNAVQKKEEDFSCEICLTNDHTTMKCIHF